MQTQEQEQRERVVAEARSWIGTPYHHMGRVKGAGVDCAMLLAEVYERSGLTPRIDVEFYPEDWHMHQNVQRFLEIVLSYCTPVDEPRPGDLALYQFGKVYSHGAIVTGYPLLVHANRSARRVEVIDGERDPHLARCKRRFFSPFK